LTIKEKRKELGLTQEQFSLLFDVPIPLSTVKKWDSGVSYPKPWCERLILDKLEQIQQSAALDEKKKLQYCSGNDRIEP